MMMNKHLSCLGMVAVLLWLCCSCKKPNLKLSDEHTEIATIMGYLENNFDFSLFAAAVQKAGLADSLNNTNLSFTVWAPVNTAFNKQGIFKPADLDNWSVDSLRFYVRSHIQPGRLFYTDIPGSSDNKFKNLNGLDLYISKVAVSNYNLLVDGVPALREGSLSSTDVNYGSTQLNGVIYTMPSLIKEDAHTVQDFLAARPEFSRLVAGFKKFGIWDQLSGDGPFTISAPPDSAFDRYNISEATIQQLDTVAYHKVLFGGYVAVKAHVYIMDIAQIGFNPGVNVFQCADTGYSQGLVTLASDFRLYSACLLPGDPGNTGHVPIGIVDHSGPTPVYGCQFMGEANSPIPVGVGAIPDGTYTNFTCSNGVVHILSGILAQPSDLKK